MPGWIAGSYGFHSDGEVYSGDTHGMGKQYAQPFGQVKDFINLFINLFLH